MHERVHLPHTATREGVRSVRGVRLRSLELGLCGVADVVELHPTPGAGGGRSRSVPFPVEYKRGRPKHGDFDLVQLCAQALCLEEMWEAAVPAGALFYGKTRRRLDVRFGPELRAATTRAAVRLHELVESGTTPKASPHPGCRACSVQPLCLPGAAGGRSVRQYLHSVLDDTPETEAWT